MTQLHRLPTRFPQAQEKAFEPKPGDYEIKVGGTGVI